MIKAIATDLDGTLLYPKRPVRLVSTRNVKLIQEFAKTGKIILVSGRGPFFCKQVQEKLGLDCSIIACSGAYIETGNQVIVEKLIPNEIVKEVDRLLNIHRNKAGLIITTDDYRLISKAWRTSLLEKIILRCYRMKNGKYNENVIISDAVFNEAVDRPGHGVLKLVLYLSDYIKGRRYEFAELLKQEIDYPLQISVTRTGMEITPAGADKGSALEQLAEQLGLAKEEVAVVGDDGNDIPMFRRFPHAFIMAHGYEGAKGEAKYVIASFKQLVAIIDMINKDAID